MSTVLVAGATGWVGTALVNELHRRGHSIVALVRPGTDASQLAEKACIVQGDVRNRDTWSDAAPPCDCLVICLGMRWWEGPLSEEDVCNIMHDGLLNVFHAAAEGGARHVVILAPIPPCDAQGRPFNHDIVRRARESAIRRIQAFAKHSCSGSASDLHGEGLLQPMKWTVVECSTFFKEFDLVHAAVQQLDGHFVVFGKGACETRMNPISARDVASCLADAVLNEWCYNKRIRVGGPDTHTLRQVVCMAADPAEPPHPVRLHTLPLWVGHLLVAVLRLLGLFFSWAATAHRVALSLLDVCRDRQPGGLVGVPCGADTLSAYAQHVHELHQQRRLASDQDSNSGGGLDDDWPDVKAQVYTAGRYNGLTHKQVLMTAAEEVLANHRERQRSVSLEKQQQQLAKGS